MCTLRNRTGAERVLCRLCEFLIFKRRSYSGWILEPPTSYTEVGGDCERRYLNPCVSPWADNFFPFERDSRRFLERVFACGCPINWLKCTHKTQCNALVDQSRFGPRRVRQPPGTNKAHASERISFSSPPCSTSGESQWCLG